MRKPAPPNAGWSGFDMIKQARSLLALHSSISARLQLYQAAIETRPSCRSAADVTISRNCGLRAKPIDAER